MSARLFVIALLGPAWKPIICARCKKLFRIDNSMCFSEKNDSWVISDRSRHNINPKGNAYRWMRKRIGTVMWIMAKDLKLGLPELQKREEKHTFYVGELLAIKEACDLSDKDFMAMLREVA